MFMGKTDFFIPIDEAKTFFEMISLEEKELKTYESGHQLPSEYINDVISWIKLNNY